jgi:hypothetical protein
MTAPQIQPMLARRLLRLAAVKVLQVKVTDATVQSPGNWATPAQKLPALLVRVQDERKASKNRGMPEFDTTCTLQVEGRLQADTPEDAQDAIEDLCFRVEEALLKCYWLNYAIVEQFAGITTRMEVTSEGKGHLGGFLMELECQTFEAFDPTETYPDGTTWPLDDPRIVKLQGVDAHLDAISPFDPSGTYPANEFASAVTPAPRTQGPDGRDEGALQINLP